MLCAATRLGGALRALTALASLRRMGGMASTGLRLALVALLLGPAAGMLRLVGAVAASISRTARGGMRLRRARSLGRQGGDALGEARHRHLQPCELLDVA